MAVLQAKSIKFQKVLCTNQPPELFCFHDTIYAKPAHSNKPMELRKRVVILGGLADLDFPADGARGARTHEVLDEGHGHVGACSDAGAGPHVPVDDPARAGDPGDVLWGCGL